MTTEILSLAPSQVVFSTALNSPPFVEALLGESVSLASKSSPIESVSVVAAPNGDPPVIDDEAKPLTVTPAAVGRHHFRVHTIDGIDTDVSVIVCEPDCLDVIRGAPHSAPVDKRRVLRQLAQFDAGFAGTTDELKTKHLANYGAT